jgi:putative endonuclease
MLISYQNGGRGGVLMGTALASSGGSAQNIRNILLNNHPRSPVIRHTQSDRSRLGKLGEAAAAEELARLGYRIRHRNYHCRGGEADLVAEDGEELVFVEVKTRSELRHGLPHEAVGWTKQQRLGVAARRYCHDYSLWDRPVRFDIVEVIVLRGEVAAVEVLRDAFVPDH